MSPKLKDSMLIFDAGTCRIRLLHGRRQEGVFQVQNFFDAPRPASSEETSALIKSRLDAWGIDKEIPMIVVCEEGTVFRQVSLPELPRKDFMRTLSWELKNKFSLLVEENLIASGCVWENPSPESGEKLHTVFHSSKKEAAFTLGLVRSAGLEPIFFLPAQAALAELAGRSQKGEDEDTMVVDVGCHTARLIVIRGRKILLSRTVAAGGQRLTEMMTESFERDGQKFEYGLEAAEKLKVEQGAADANAPHYGLARPYFEKIAFEIKRSMDYHESRPYAAPISRIFLAGGGSELKGLCEHLTSLLGMETSLLKENEALRGLLTSSQVLDGGWMTAIGAGLSEDGTFNLLPHSAGYEKTLKLRKTITSFYPTFVAVLGIVTLFGFSNFMVARARLKTVNIEWKETVRLQSLLKELSTRDVSRRNLLRGHFYYVGFFKELSRLTPDYVMLEEMLYDRQNDELILRGSAAQGPEEVKAIAQFLENLSKSVFFKNATLVNSGRSDSGAPTFEIRCLIRGIS